MNYNEAQKIRDDCEGTVDECVKCPLGKRLCVSGEGKGFDLMFSACSLLNLLDEVLTDDSGYIYKPDY